MSSKRSQSSTRRRKSDDTGRRAFIDAVNFLFVVAGTRGRFNTIPTAEEFLAAVETKSSKKRSWASRSKRGGASQTNLDALLQYILGAAVGRFDTPCNRVMSYISIALYAVMLYSLSEASMEIHVLKPQASCLEVITEAMGPPTYTEAIHTPTRWFLRHYFPAIESGTNALISNLQNQFDVLANQNNGVLRSMNICRPSQIGGITYMGLQSLFTSLTYRAMIINPVACLLYRAGMTSCRDLCDVLGLLGSR